MQINWFDTILVFLGGLGLFFYGMKQLSTSLQAMSGDLIKKVLASLTANRFLGVCVGTFLTALIQSSSVMTVMTVSFVNAGLMNLAQAISIIFGANIGTTITGWIIAIKIGKYGLHLIGLGAFPTLFFKDGRWKVVGSIIFALGLIFFGLQTMSGAFKPLRTDPTFMSYLTYFQADTFFSLICTVGMGCLLTIVIQSSSAMLGITIALASAGTIEFQTAAALVLGENIGTTITALLACVGTNSNARRTAIAHCIFNCSAVIGLLLVFHPYVAMVESLVPHDSNLLVDGTRPNIAAHIAASHTIFNVTATIVFLPFLGALASLVTWLIPSPPYEEQETLKLIGDPHQISPTLAIEQAYAEIYHMAELTQKMLGFTKDYVLEDGGDEMREKVIRYEEITDNIQKEVLLFLCTVMERPLTTTQSLKINAMLSISDDLESIADYCESLARFKKRLVDGKHELREETRDELTEFINLTQDTFKIIVGELDCPETVSITRFDHQVRRLKEMARATRDQHLDRIKDQKYAPLSGLTFTDMVISLRKIMGHMAGINKAIDSFQNPR